MRPVATLAFAFPDRIMLCSTGDIFVTGKTQPSVNSLDEDLNALDTMAIVTVAVPDRVMYHFTEQAGIVRVYPLPGFRQMHPVHRNGGIRSLAVGEKKHHTKIRSR